MSAKQTINAMTGESECNRGGMHSHDLRLTLPAKPNRRELNPTVQGMAAGCMCVVAGSAITLAILLIVMRFFT